MDDARANQVRYPISSERLAGKFHYAELIAHRVRQNVYIDHASRLEAYD